jgi:hypothetical protein
MTAHEESTKQALADIRGFEERTANSLEGLALKLGEVEEKVAEVNTPPLPETMPPPPETKPAPEDWWERWGLPLVLGAMAVLLIVVLVFGVWRLRRENARLDEQFKALGRNFIWERVPYEHDGKQYWVELQQITREGRWYKTPFGDHVKEEDLRPHFTEEIRKKKT